MTNQETAYLAGGCFWGIERLFQNVPGVVASTVGYTQSNTPNPSYQQVCTGSTDAVETVEIKFDTNRVTLSTLVRLLLDTIDPFSENRQGPDIGTQYRSGLFFTSPQQQSVYEEEIARAEKQLGKLAVAVEPLNNFYPAEDNHQDYLLINPGGYCHVPPFKIAAAGARAAELAAGAPLSSAAH